MRQNLTHIAIVVDDYDKAINFYTQKLHFTLTEDTVLTDTKRWVLVTPKGAKECSLLLTKGVNEEQKSRIGNQTGGRVFLFLHTYNFKQDYQNLLDNQIKIVREPTIETYGTVAVFEDIYGNLWDLIEPNKTKDNLYYSTAIFTINDASKITLAISELSKLRQSTLLENGNIDFDIQQSIDDQTKIIITECFENEQVFKEHLGSIHLQDFLKLDLVKLENGFTTKKIL